MRAGPLCLAGATALLLTSAEVRAEDAETPRFSLAYEAPEGCPDREAFLAAIRARTARPRLVEEGEGAAEALVFHVRITSDDTSATGVMEVRDPDGERQERSVRSATCGEVTKALALVSALLLDPDAATGPQEPEPPPSPPPPPPPPPPEPKPKRPPPPKPVPFAPRWSTAAGVQVGVLGGVAPTAAPLGGATLEVRHARERTSSLGRASVDVAGAWSGIPGGGTQRYLFVGGEARACPILFALPIRAPVRLGPCAALRAGVHAGSSLHVPNAESHADLWLAPGAGGTVTWDVTPRWSLALDGTALAPLRRTRFFLAPSTTLYDVPAVTAEAALGVQMRFF